MFSKNYNLILSALSIIDLRHRNLELPCFVALQLTTKLAPCLGSRKRNKDAGATASVMYN